MHTKTYFHCWLLKFSNSKQFIKYFQLLFFLGDFVARFCDLFELDDDGDLCFTSPAYHLPALVLHKWIYRLLLSDLVRTMLPRASTQRLKSLGIYFEK